MLSLDMTLMDFDPTPYAANSWVWYVGLISAVILALKGCVVCLTEFVRMIPPLIQSIKDCIKAIYIPREKP